MLGTFLDVAEAEGRERLTGGEKAAMVAGGLSARVEAAVPARVRTGVASILVGLLGAFGLFSGAVFEWAPWGGAARAHILAQLTAFNGQTFGPFLSPFALVAAAAIAALLACLFAPEWLYRCVLAATVIGGAAVSVMAHDGTGGFAFLRATPPLFASVVAAFAFLAPRPQKAPVLFSGGAWLTVFVVSPALWGPLPLSHLVSGYPYGAPIFFDDVIPPALTYFGSLLTLLIAAMLIATHRARFAAIIVLASVPFALLSAVHGWFGRDPIYLVVLGTAYAVVIAIPVIRSTRPIQAADSNPDPRLLA
jgi:hypothetical protein